MLTFSLRNAFPGRILTAEVTPENPQARPAELHPRLCMRGLPTEQKPLRSPSRRVFVDQVVELGGMSRDVSY